MRTKFNVRVMWPDCDPAKIVFHGNYFRWMDDAGMILLAALGYDFDRMTVDLGVPGSPMLGVHADFPSPARLGDELVVESWISRVGNTSYRMRHDIRVGDRLVCVGWQERIWCTADADDPSQLKPIPVPPEIRAALCEDEAA